MKLALRGSDSSVRRQRPLDTGNLGRCVVSAEGQAVQLWEEGDLLRDGGGIGI